MNTIRAITPVSDAAGCATIEIERVFRESTVTSAFATSPMKLLVPRSRGPSAWAYTSSFGGGLVAGDQTQLRIRLGSDTRCVIGTQASTKIYRNPCQLPCSHHTHATVGVGSLLVFTPDPVQPFSESIYEQRQEFHLADGAGLALLDWFTAGRPARGERWAFARFRTRNDVFLGSERVYLDSLLLDSSAGSAAAAHRGGRFNCFATLVFIGQPLRNAAATLLSKGASTPIERRGSLISSASPIRDGAVLRVAGQESEQVGRELYHQLQPLSEVLGDDPWQRKL